MTESTELFGEYTRLAEEWKKAYKEIFNYGAMVDFSLYFDDENDDNPDLIVKVIDKLIPDGVSITVMKILAQKRGRFNPYWIKPSTYGWLKIGYYILPHDYEKEDDIDE